MPLPVRIIIITNWRCTDWLTLNPQRKESIRSEVKTAIKKVEAAVAANDKEAAKAALTVAISTIESASSKGVYHKNNAGRKVSRLTKLVNTLA